MSRQIFTRVLLSLLLLLSQQMASAHALSHLAGKIDGTVQLSQLDDGDLSSAFAQDQTCNQCLVFAQMATPLAASTPTFALGDATDVLARTRSFIAPCARTVCVFQSRAPPQA